MYAVAPDGTETVFGSSSEAMAAARDHLASNPSHMLRSRPLPAPGVQGAAPRVVWRVMTSTGGCAVWNNIGDCAAFADEISARSALAALRPVESQAGCMVRSFYSG